MPPAWSLILILTFFLNACGIFPVMNKTPAPLPDPGWKTLTGQVQYRDDKRSFVADVTIRTAAEGTSYSMEITKAGANLLKLDRRSDLGWARGPAAGLPFAGKMRASPSHLQRWFTETDAAIQRSLQGLESRPPSASDVTIHFRLQS